MLFFGFSLCACSDETEKMSTETSIETSVSTSEESEPSVDASTDEREDEFEVSADLQTVLLGRYEQDADSTNGAEQIEWIVLETDGQKALVISKNILDCKPYNDGYKESNWENCSARKWLNGEFWDAAFTDGEKAKILETFVTDYDPELIKETDESVSGNDASGNDTSASESVNETVLTGVYDKIFLLSDFETLKYLPDDRAVEGDEAYAYPTKYAISQGVWVLTRDLFESGHYVENGYDEKVIGAGWWWLRNNTVSTKSQDVDTTGTIRINGHDVGENHDGLRPAMWISLE